MNSIVKAVLEDICSNTTTYQMYKAPNLSGWDMHCVNREKYYIYSKEVEGKFCEIHFIRRESREIFLDAVYIGGDSKIFWQQVAEYFNEIINMNLDLLHNADPWVLKSVVMLYLSEHAKEFHINCITDAVCCSRTKYVLEHHEQLYQKFVIFLQLFRIS